MGVMKTVLALLAVSRVAAQTKFKFGMDTDWPPYAFKNAQGGLEGIGKDIADGMNAACTDVEIEVVEVPWSDCWTSDDNLGQGLANGAIDACMTYTHGRGSRDQKADFSMAFLKVDKSAGFITRLDADGKPVVCGTDNLSGKAVADVGGWAPTADSIEMVKNQCSNTPVEVKTADVKVVNLVAGTNVNDEALKQVLDGTVDLLYVYADNAETFKCKNDGVAVEHDCTLWDKLGQPCGYAYVQTGMFGWTLNGTTLAMTKPGSPAAQGINHCLHKFMQTKQFYDVCVKHGMECDCVPNSHFPNTGCTTAVYNKPTTAHTNCNTGYCPCDATCTNAQSNQCAASSAQHHTISTLSFLAFIFSTMILAFGW